MERNHETAELIELGTASTETLGVEVGIVPEERGFYPIGLIEQ